MSTSSNHSRRVGFTLVELLVVMAIIVVLIGLVSAPVGQMLHGSNLTQSGNTVGDQLGLARQSALSSNRKVQVRFYSLPTAANNATTTVTGMQTLRVEPSGTTTPLTKIQQLTTNVILANDATHSTILGNPNPTVSGTTTLAAYNNLSCKYVGFQFLPDGSTDLGTTFPAGSNGWFLTLVDSTKPLPASGAPVNYYTLRVEPLTGHTRLFRP